MELDKKPSFNLYASELVKEALKNAELVLFYITETGINVNQQDVEVITKSKQALEKDLWNVDLEVEFWIAYKNLTASIAPINIDSLRAFREGYIKKPNFFQRLFRKKRNATLSYRTVRFYSIFTIVTLIIMLFLHIYFSIGTIRLNRIQASNERLSSLEKQLNEMDLIISGGSTNISVQQKYDKLQNELFEVNSEKETNIKLLSKWLENIQKVIGTYSSSVSNKTATQPEDVGSNQTSVPGPPVAPEKQLNNNIEIIQEAQNFILIIGFYILPLLYGLLGALTYVLRDLSVQTKKMLYSKDSNINHILRIVLGSIAGFAVGVFWGEMKQQEKFIIIQSLGPLLVAYLSGLTVEYVFSAIETWIGSLLQRALNNSKK